MLVLPHFDVTTAPWELSCHAGCSCGSQLSYLGRTASYFPRLEASGESICTMKENSREGGFQAIYSLILPSPFSKCMVSSALWMSFQLLEGNQ